MNLIVSYYTKKRQDDANLLSTSQEDKWLVKKEKINPFDSPRSEAWGMPSTRAQAEGLRVDTERRFLHGFKFRVWRRRMYGNVAFLRRRRQNWYQSSISRIDFKNVDFRKRCYYNGLRKC